jgi:UDPglucose--hexose-1-phosphate uridylyltransferase
MLQLVPTVERTRLVDPAGRDVEQVIEHRVDPLTGTVASINTALGEKARAFLGAGDPALLADLQEKTRAACPFCAAAEKGTRFPADVVPEGQLRVGRSVAFPNLFSKAALDAVVVLDPGAHVLFPARLAPDALGSALAAVAELVRRARGRPAPLLHHLAGMNFLGPGGSSVPHPHFQVQARAVPYSGVARLLALAADARNRLGQGYWEVLLATERGGPRHVGATGPVEWLAAWAPAHQKEIWGLLPGKSSLGELTDDEAGAFGAGIARVGAFYEAQGQHAFTLAFLSSPEAGASDHVLQIRLCARPAFRAHATNYDTWYGPLLAGDDAHTEAPETYAARLRSGW